MIIGVDVDEVVADMLPEWVRLYNAAWDDKLKVSDITSWDMTQFVKPECGARIYDLLRLDSFYMGVKPLPRALEAVTVLRSMGHRVVFVSSCVRHTLNEKLEWLVRHKFVNTMNAQPDFVAAKDKNLVAVDILFDDNIPNVETFPHAAVLVDAGHNLRTPCYRPRIAGLWDAPRYLAELITC